MMRTREWGFARLYEENWTLSVMEDMERPNERSLTIGGQWNLILASRFQQLLASNFKKWFPTLWTREKGQTMIYKTQHTKLKTEQHESYVCYLTGCEREENYLNLKLLLKNGKSVTDYALQMDFTFYFAHLSVSVRQMLKCGIVAVIVWQLDLQRYN